MLLGQSRILSAIRKAARQSKADDTLIAAQRTARKTLRFADGRIHQNFHEEETTVWVKVAVSGKTGVATTGAFNPASILKTIEAAMTIASASAKGVPASFRSKPVRSPSLPIPTHDPETADLSLTRAVEMIRTLSSRTSKQGMDLAGSFVFGEDELAVAGKGGLAQYQPFSIAGLRLVPTRQKSSGFAAQTVRRICDLDQEALIERAWRLCRLNRDPKAVPTGAYDVLLEAEAVAELLEWLGFIGFGAKQLTERTGFTAGRIGEKIMHPSVSISDDGLDPQGLMAPFDYEGIPKRRVALVEHGVIKGVVYDSHYAKIHRTDSTGHALPYEEIEGPLPTNLFMDGGTTPHSALLKQLGRGLWVSRFHYVSGLLKPQEAVMTGLTRDGTFLIREGQVTQAVKNLRFTQSILEAFSKIAAISRERRLIADPGLGFGSVVAPAVLIKGFNFTGQTR
ncbi:MAG: TldD/PmbA family protein [Candidatus Omnitrophica bacterium]|nr:TldD/PmbA family protein [Candidatus Omnitrophota bacterium]